MVPAGKKTTFLPTTREEMNALGWDACDVVIVTGDSYIDAPFIGAAVVGRLLEDAGFRVGIIGQPDIGGGEDIARLGEPALFWGVTGGSIDSMVANYTATGKFRKSDDYTPGGRNDRRPDRAVIAYTNLIRRYFPKTKPIVLGGVEASLRRVAHYDFWTDRVRRSVLFDAKADLLLYGMADRSVVELARCLQSGADPSEIRGLCYASRSKRDGYLELPSFAEVSGDREAFAEAFGVFYRNCDPLTARGLVQKQDSRYLVHNPPPLALSEQEIDHSFGLPYQRDLHPWYRAGGEVRALETIRFSLLTHRGCYGECSFCAIAIHEGRTVQSRSEASILEEARLIARLPGFKGYILDAGGPTANMYGIECRKKLEEGACADKRCVFPAVCRSLRPDHGRQIRLLRRLRELPGIKAVFVASGIRYDLVFADKAHGREYLAEVVRHHVSGQMKVAPEHTEDRVLALMGKPGLEPLLEFKREFDRLSTEAGKRQFLTYYLMAAHPGCGLVDMERLGAEMRKRFRIEPEQVQVFTPTPSTYSSLMYWTERDPFSGKDLFVEKKASAKQAQKDAVTGGRSLRRKPAVKKARFRRGG